MVQLLNDKSALVNHIIHVLHERSDRGQIYSPDAVDPLAAAGVLLLLSHRSSNNKEPGQPCLILNKRSLKVRQPGDLCCPGGSVDPLSTRILPDFYLCLSYPLAAGDTGANGKKINPR